MRTWSRTGTRSWTWNWSPALSGSWAGEKTSSDEDETSVSLKTSSALALGMGVLDVVVASSLDEDENSVSLKASSALALGVGVLDMVVASSSDEDETSVFFENFFRFGFGNWRFGRGCHSEPTFSKQRITTLIDPPCTELVHSKIALHSILPQELDLFHPTSAQLVWCVIPEFLYAYVQGRDSDGTMKLEQFLRTCSRGTFFMSTEEDANGRPTRRLRLSLCLLLPLPLHLLRLASVHPPPTAAPATFSFAPNTAPLHLLRPISFLRKSEGGGRIECEN